MENTLEGEPPAKEEDEYDDEECEKEELQEGSFRHGGKGIPVRCRSSPPSELIPSTEGPIREVCVVVGGEDKEDTTPSAGSDPC